MDDDATENFYRKIMSTKLQTWYGYFIKNPGLPSGNLTREKAIKSVLSILKANPQCSLENFFISSTLYFPMVDPTLSIKEQILQSIERVSPVGMMALLDSFGNKIYFTINKKDNGDCWFEIILDDGELLTIVYDRSFNKEPSWTVL